MLSFVLPYVIGTAAMIDRSGRLATAALAVQVFSYGTGGAIGGLVVEHFSLASLGLIGFSGLSSQPVFSLWFAGYLPARIRYRQINDVSFSP